MRNTDYGSVILKSMSTNSSLEKWNVLAYSWKNFYLQNLLYTLFPRQIFQTMSHGSKAVSKVVIMCSYLNLIQIQITNRNSQKFSLLSTAHYSGLDRWTYFSPILPITTQIIWIRTTAEPITKTRTSELWSFQTFYKHKSHTSSKTKFVHMNSRANSL